MDETGIYFVDSERHELLRCALPGCSGTPEVVASPTGSYEHWTGNLLVDATHVYWATGRFLFRCKKTGCPGGPETVHFVAAPAGTLTAARLVSGGRVLIASHEPGVDRLSTCPVSGCEGGPLEIVRAPRIGGFGADEAHAYFATIEGDAATARGAIRRCPLEGCAAGPASIIDGVAPSSVTASGGKVYFDDRAPDGSSVLLACATAGCSGAPEHVVSSPAPPRGLAIGDGTAFWLHDIGEHASPGRGTWRSHALESCSLMGCTRPRRLAAPLVDGQQIAIAADAIYVRAWETTWRLPR